MCKSVTNLPVTVVSHNAGGRRHDKQVRVDEATAMMFALQKDGHDVGELTRTSISASRNPRNAGRYIMMAFKNIGDELFKQEI